jgi:peroxiredoxin
MDSENDVNEVPGTRDRPRAATWLIFGGGFLVGLLMMVLILGGNNQPNAQGVTVVNLDDSVSAALVQVGKPAPPISAQTPDGDTLNLSDLRGKMVAINFWATWCPPCRVEMPALQAAYTGRANGDLVVLAVNVGEPASQVQDFVDEFDLTFPVVLDPSEEIANTYGVKGLPVTIWVDSEGIVQNQHIGLLTDDLIERYLDELMGVPDDAPVSDEG